MHIGFLDYRRQRLLGHPPRLQEAREVTALPQLRDPQLDGSGPGLPIAIAVAVALVGSGLAAFAVPGATQRLGLQCHQSLRGKADHLAQQTGVRGLLQERLKSDLVVGHRGGLQGQSCVSQHNPTQEHRGDHRCG